jgi:hypothetical protein
MSGSIARTLAPLAAAAALLVGGAAPQAQQRAPVSKRNANYSIDVDLDPASRTLTGRQVVTWRNITAKPASELQFHLYYNGWRNTASTFMRERARLFRELGWGRMPVPRRHEWGWIDVTAIRLLGTSPTPFVDLTGSERFIAPDDVNRDDRTVMRVQLPKPVPPGGSLTIELAWTAHVPRPIERTGAVGDFFFIAQWFPKLGVLQHDGWNTHQFHATTEFFSDYGVYDVRITVPSGWLVGATGRATQRLELPSGRTTHRFVQEDVHDFAWTTSPAFVERHARFEQPGLPAVDMRLLVQPEHVPQASRLFAATRAALLHYGRWYGPYPYGHITIVDPAWQSGAGGMEYPTLFTTSTRWLAPAGSLDPEEVTVHEAGHQFWYGLVGTNEFEDAWLDEGLNTFSTARVLARELEPRYYELRAFGDFIPWVIRDVRLSREDHDGLAAYREGARSDALATPSWQYDPREAGAISYSKTAVWLHMLERTIGWPRLQRGLSLFFTRYRFMHPGAREFFETVQEGAGGDLAHFFEEMRGSNVLDYGVQQLTSAPMRVVGMSDATMPPADDTTQPKASSAPADAVPTATQEPLVFSDRTVPNQYVTELIVRRYGEVVLPVDVEVTFENGERVRERWDGRERWRLYRWERPVRARAAQVDPDRVLAADLNRTNDSWSLQPRGAEAGAKWSLTWMVWMQDALLTWASLV